MNISGEKGSERAIPRGDITHESVKLFGKQFIGEENLKVNNTFGDTFMWRVTIIANTLMMGLFWLASLLSVSIAYNRFVQYPSTKAPMALPVATELALSNQLWAGILPLTWIILSYVIWQKLKDKKPESRSEYLLAFTVVTMAIGFAMLIFFALAGTLPFLFIKTLVK